MVVAWEGDLSAPDWEAQAGQVWMQQPVDADNVFTADAGSEWCAEGIGGVAPTLRAWINTPDGGGVAMARRWHLPTLGFGTVDEAGIGYRIHVPAGYLAAGAGDKAPGLAGKVPSDTDPLGIFNLAQAGYRPGDSWTLRTLVQPYGVTGAYLYAEQPSAGAPYGATIPATVWQPGWNDVLWRVRMNTPGEPDGVLQMWLNGWHVLSRHDIEFRSAEMGDLGISLMLINVSANAGTPAFEVHLADFRLYLPAV